MPGTLDALPKPTVRPAASRGLSGRTLGGWRPNRPAETRSSEIEAARHDRELTLFSLLFRQHDAAGERRQLAIDAGEVGLDPSGFGGPGAPECSLTSAWRGVIPLGADVDRRRVSR